jgi:hypothetical protein
MKQKMLTAKAMVLLLFGLLTSTSCGIRVTDLMATHVPPAVAATLTAIAVTQKVTLLSFHGRYVTAMEGGGGWFLTQERNLSDCAKFTLDYQDDGKVALISCYGRYVTAPKTGATRSDWRLWQDTELSECGQFVLYDLGGGDVAIETCAGKVLTAGDGAWPGELAWAVVAETDDIKDWERFRMSQPYTPLQSMIVNFDSCTGFTKLGGEMGAAFIPPDNSLVVSYVPEDRPGCVARLEYEIVDWGGFWIRLQGADLSPYSQLVFDIKADPQEIPKEVKIELKRAGLQEVSIRRISGITAEWQTMSVNLEDFEGSLPSFADMEELAFVFEANDFGSIGVVYLDNIAVRRAWDNP